MIQHFYIQLMQRNSRFNLIFIKYFYILILINNSYISPTLQQNPFIFNIFNKMKKEFIENNTSLKFELTLKFYDIDE